MKAFSYSHNRSTSSTPSKPPKNQHKTHQDLENGQFYKLPKVLMDEKMKIEDERGKRRVSYH